ncbi:hypothetical protein JJD41_14250 [Oxynema sp. CENA135]|nr:hypothetical protein [Oxynema sp. CENA135]
MKRQGSSAMTASGNLAFPRDRSPISRSPDRDGSSDAIALDSSLFA